MSDLQTKIQDVINLLEVSGQEAEQVVKDRLLLEERELKNQHFKRELEKNKEDLDKRSLDLDQQKEFINKKNKELIMRETALQENKQLLIDIQTVQVLLDNKKREVASEMEKLDEKMAQFKELDKREAKLNEKEARLEREKTIDRERKAQLDIQEEALIREQTRLQKVAETFKIAK